MDSRPRNNNGQFAPEEMSGVDANTTSAAYNPQIIEARKATLAEKLRRAIGLRRGVEESVPQEQKVLSRFNHGGHGEHGGVKEFSILNKISNLTGMAQIKAGREALDAAKYNRSLRDAYRADAVKQNKFPYRDSGLQYKIESGMRHRAIARGTDAKYDVRRARKLINEGVRRRNISIGVGAGAVGAGAVAGYLATREKDLSAKLRLRELAEYKPSEEALRLRDATLAYNKFIGDEEDWQAASNSEKGLKLRGAHAAANNAVQQKGIQSQWHLPFGIGKKAKAWRQYNQDMDWVNSHLSAKLRLRELARQAAYDPYAVQAQPPEPGQTGRDFRNAALGIGALGAGGGVAYAGFRGAQAAKSAQTLTDDALKTSGEARKAARSARVAAARVNRAGKVIKTQLTTFPTFKKVASKIFEEDLQSLKELADRSVELNSITYHETNADILRRKARGHREKRDESTGMWPYAVAAPGILAASPALRAESSGRVASLGKKLWKGEHADNTAHIGNKVAGILRAHPGKVVSALALAPAAVLGGNLAYHTIAARSKDSGVNKELKLANEMRRQRNAEALKKS